MAKKLTAWKTKGMNRDLSVSAFNPEFAFENMNLRLSTNDGNTMLSWVNEKGTAQIELVERLWNSKDSNSRMCESEIIGVPIGTAVLNHTLVLFTHQVEESVDRIYKIKYKDAGAPSMQALLLYQGSLNFDAEYPLETLVSYESETVQKVYWTDGKNQPRVVNIASDVMGKPETYFDFVPTLQLNETVTVQKMLGANGLFAPGVIQYAFTYYNKYGQESNIFYTTPLHYISNMDRGASPEDKVVENAFKITVANLDRNFDYLRIYSIQRTSVNATPFCKRVQDISVASAYTDQIATERISELVPEIKIGKDYKLPSEVDTSVADRDIDGTTYRGFLKSEHPNLLIRASESYITWGENATGDSVIWISSLKIDGYYKIIGTKRELFIGNPPLQGMCIRDESYGSASYIDTGTSGDSVDPTELLYKGGEVVTAETMEQKDGTLFMGNISTERASLKDIGDIAADVTLTSSDSDRRTIYPTVISTGDYYYASQLTSFSDSAKTKSVPCGGFKRGDYYRCGVQFQHKSGKWSEPAWVDDIQVAAVPITSGDSVQLPVIRGILSNRNGLLTSLYVAGYRKLRPVVVFPEIQDRVTICQAVANPTLYTDNHRTYETTEEETTVIKGDNDLYAQSSWFFRPESSNGTTEGTTIANDVSPEGAVYPTGINTLRYIGNAAIGKRYSDKVDTIIGKVKRYRTEYTVSPEDPTNIRQVEIQGGFNPENRFKIDRSLLTLHSPDICFDDQMLLADYTAFSAKQVGQVEFTKTLSDIDIQTSSPTISNTGAGFVHKSFSSNKAFGIVSGLFYDDGFVDDSSDEVSQAIFEPYMYQKSPVKWMTYLWNKTGSLNNDINRPSDKGVPSAVLKKKVISNLRYTDTVYDTDDSIETKARLRAEIILPEPDDPGDTPSSGGSTSGGSENNTPIDFKTQLFSSDQVTILKSDDKVYMGNIDTVLNPDFFTGMFFAFNTVYIKEPSLSKDSSSQDLLERFSGVYTPFIADGEVWWKTFSKSDSESNDNGMYIYSGYDESMKPEWLQVSFSGGSIDDIGDAYVGLVVKRDLVRMKYKSTAHLVCAASKITGLNWLYDKLPVVEIQRDWKEDDRISTMFGGRSMDAFKENTWIPCGEPVSFSANDSEVRFEYSYGDTYYQRWDCLKTYAFTPEDENQVVEIGSFMLETHTNIDGRYDRNRAQMNNLNMSPINFNLHNPVYNQIDNFFTYRIMDEDFYDNKKYPNQITWSKTKNSGADVDAWTNVTLASILELDGDKGKVNKLVRLNNFLFAFQDTGISQIMYNDNVQIQSTQGVPIEIANSGKVQGKDYKSATIGCSNKWSMVTTPAGIYFMDSNDKSIYLFNGQLSNLSAAGGMNSWCKSSIPATKKHWIPDFSTGDFVTYYDKQNQDVLFINSDVALAWSEKFQAFTSFYNYGNTPFFCNLDDTGIWIKNSQLWKHQAGDYCRFFEVNKPYWMILVGNPEPQLDKIFTNLEFRACVEGDGELDQETGKFTFSLPFDYLETWNEYQRGVTFLSHRNGTHSFKHHETSGNASLKRKFRIWRCDIPRNNFERLSGSSFDTTFDYTFRPRSISRKSNDRMRNPWLYLQLLKNIEADTAKSLPKAEIHDVVMTYFN